MTTMMQSIKKTAGLWAAIALLAGLAVANLAAQQDAAPKTDQPLETDQAMAEEGQPLSPEPQHLLASRLATRFVSGYHYHRAKLDEDISDRIFDQYLKLLDPNRMYFTATDVADFERYRPHMEKALKTSELDPAFEVFNRYVKRVQSRVEFARARLAEGFDFTQDEKFYFDRSEADWAEDDATLERYWAQRVKNDYLRLKLADKEDEEIQDTLDQRYEGLARRISELNAEDVFQFFMNAYTRSIEPHSSYLSPRSVENFEISMRLSLDGIGALLQRETEYTSIVEVIPGGPADLDGRLQEGDRIVGVAQGDEELVDVVGWRLDDVVSLIRGERETRVRLEVLPAESGLSGPPTTIELVRNEVKLEEQAASSEVIELPERTIGVIKVPVFYVDFEGRAANKPDYRSSTRDVRRMINELTEQGVDGLVVDLRGNGGGALVEATTMTGLFIDEGPVVQVRDSRGRVNLEKDQEPGMAWDGPLAVLVDRRSASASEIFAGAIQDYGRGVVIGEPTFGKGTVQNMIDLDHISRSDIGLGQMKLTMAQFYRVAGGSTQSRGVQPDIRLPTPGDPEDVGESSMEYALPWAEIDPADYEPMANLSGLIDQAQQRHLARRDSDPELADLVADVAKFEEDSERDYVSLNEATRRARMAEAEDERRERFGQAHDALASADDGEDGNDSSGDEPANDEEGSPVPEDDIYLIESARILADLMALDGDLQVVAHRSLPAATMPSDR